MREYYLLLRSILKSQPSRRPCLTRCRHCRIFFLTHPRNARRHDLRCPFGCQEAYRKERSNERSLAYYREPEGKIKKAIQNAKRRQPVPRAPAVALPFAEPILKHVQEVVSWIEARLVCRQEILRMLWRVLRQHRMARRRRIDQAVDWLNANPP